MLATHISQARITTRHVIYAPCAGQVQYMTQDCGVSTDRECADCNVCDDNHFINTACTKTENTICQRCDTHCGSKSKYMSQPCTATANRVCTDCSVCGASQYMTQDCGVSTDRECADCNVCDDNHFINTACTETENTILSTMRYSLWQ